MTTNPKADEANTSSPEDADADAEFDNAFAEFAGNADKPEPSDPPEDGRQGEDGEGQPNGGDDAAGDAGKRPDPSASEGQGKPNAADQQQGTDLPDTDRELERLREFERRSKGHVSTLQRQLNEATARLNQYQQGQPAQQRQASPAGTGKTDGKAAPAGADRFESDPELKQFAKEYPELVPALRKLTDPLVDQVGRLNAELAQYSEGHRQEAYTSNRNTVLDAHPDFDQAIRSKEFADWFNASPPYVQDGIKRNGQQIVDPEEVKHLTDQFKAETGWKSSQNPPSGKPGGTPNQPSRNPDPVRDRRLRAAPETRDTGPGRASGVPDEFDAAFDHYAARKAKAAG